MSVNMNDFTVYVENESGSRLPPFSVEEGSRRVPKLEDAAGFAVVEGELHVRHCGSEASELRILRKGRVRAVRPGQSYRVMPGDSLCVANRAYRISEVYRKERPKRSLLGMTARSIALGAATAAAMLVGCNTNANRIDIDEVDVNPLGGEYVVEISKEEMDAIVAECLAKPGSAQDKANCCMGLDSDEGKMVCCDELYKTSPDAHCEVHPQPTQDRLAKPRTAQDKAEWCMGLDSDDDVKYCCDWVHEQDPSVFCEVGVNIDEGEPMEIIPKDESDPVAACLAKPGSAEDKAGCCMLDLNYDNVQPCCDELHKTSPDVYCTADVIRKAFPQPLQDCFTQNESPEEQAKCCMGLGNGLRKECCDSLHRGLYNSKINPASVYCEESPSPTRTCLTQNESAQDKAKCCMGLSSMDDTKKCCDVLHEQDPSAYCEALPKSIRACFVKPESAKDKAKCCMAQPSGSDTKKCCNELHKTSPDVFCEVRPSHKGGVLRDPPAPKPVKIF